MPNPYNDKRPNTPPRRGENGGKEYYTATALVKFSELDEKNYVKNAERIIKHHKDKHFHAPISISQLRNILDLLNELRERLRNERVSELDDEMVSQVQYIKLRLVYAAGRDNKSVRDFIIESDLIAGIDSVDNSAKKFLFVCKYTEALVAYHKYYINK